MTTYTAQEVIDYIKDLETPDNDVPDYYFSVMKKNKTKFELKTVNIEDLLKSDESLAEYVNTGENRYENSTYEPSGDELDHPIVILDGEVIDGYNRTGANYRAGNKTINAYVSI